MQVYISREIVVYFLLRYIITCYAGVHVGVYHYKSRLGLSQNPVTTYSNTCKHVYTTIGEGVDKRLTEIINVYTYIYIHTYYNIVQGTVTNLTYE